MALKQEELHFDTNTQNPQLRAYITARRTVTFASVAADAVIPYLYPVAYDSSQEFFVQWAKPVQEVGTITAGATAPTGGTFTYTLNGVTTATIAYNATPAQAQAALEALHNVNPGDIVVTEAGGGIDTAAGTLTATFSNEGQYRGTAVSFTATLTSLTGGTGEAYAQDTAGVDSNETDVPVYFAGPFSEHQSLTEAEQGGIPVYDGSEATGVVVTAGELYLDDLPVDSGDLADFSYIAAKVLRDKDIYIQGLNTQR